MCSPRHLFDPLGVEILARIGPGHADGAALLADAAAGAQQGVLYQRAVFEQDQVVNAARHEDGRLVKLIAPASAAGLAREDVGAARSTESPTASL
ncbi:hypothetical protein [Chelatococcus asaccharovorans]|uniref:hypothetical protein n=1 Tax=Chelatococcus asaccharovorans TaxID=28210 RepID=UPI00224C7AE5|nr:hypothetical protein [Chelatococcus asaccharovorans]CAH1672901.1 hypothetical protein CHELA17_61448 [Chelatococcus asaccharovorans]CAH1675681.1 hypothetical protein CHELA40_14173 [Chelatococcus asaccharovorans]